MDTTLVREARRTGRLVAVLCLVAALLTTTGFSTRADLVLHFTFDDENDPGFDNSGNGYEGELEGALWVEDDEREGALEFVGGNNAYLRVRELQELPGDDFTITFWAYRDPLTATGGNDGLFQIQLGGDIPSTDPAGKVVGAWVAGSGGVWGRLHQQNQNRVNLDANTFFMENETWTHFAYRGDGESFEVLVNGEPATGPLSFYDGTLALHDTLFVGKQGAESWGGRIDDFRVYNRALGDDEIASVMEGEDGPAQPTCVGAARVTRELSTIRDVTTSSGDFEDGDELPVVLALSELREATPDCPMPVDLVLTETLPEQWGAKDVSDGGSYDAQANTITWSLPAAQVTDGKTVSYVAVAVDDGTSGVATFRGELLEEGQQSKTTRGESRLFPPRDFDDCGGIKVWNVLGGFAQPGGANPGEELMRMDFLTDGEITELDFLWFPGATIATAYNGAAASTGLISGDPAKGRNPDGVPRVFAFNDGDGGWLNLNDDVFGSDPNNVMAYQQVYIVNTGDSIEVNIGASSDDAIQVILNEEEVWINSVARGGVNDACAPQDVAPDGFTFVDPLLLESGTNSLIVKTFEGGGGWNSTITFLDIGTNQPILNGDADGDGEQDLFLQKLPDICVTAPVKAVRSIDAKSTVKVQHQDTLGWQTGDAVGVQIAIADVREEGTGCSRPASVTITETAPDGFAISGVTPDGDVAGNVITWTLTGDGVSDQTLSYTATAGGTPRNVTFTGSVLGEGDPTSFATTGDSSLANPSGFSGDQGFINSWLVLGPYVQSTGFGNPNRAAPGEDNMRMDWLTDGDSLFELEIEPTGGDTVNTDFGGASPATGIGQGAGDCGLNAGDPAVPTWFAWNDQDDTIAFEDYYCGNVDNIMMYAVAYVHSEEAVTWDLGAASDDAIQILVNDVEVHLNSIARDSGGSNTVQDVVAAVDLQEGVNKIMVKVWEGAGGHNFRLRFQDPITQDGVTGGMTVCLDPANCPPELPVGGGASLIPGDVNHDGSVNISDPVSALNFLFGGQAIDPCYGISEGGSVTLTEAGLLVLDWNGDGAHNIADPVASLGAQFGGGSGHVLGTDCTPIDGACTDSTCE